MFMTPSGNDIDVKHLYFNIQMLTLRWLQLIAVLAEHIIFICIHISASAHQGDIRVERKKSPEV